MLRNLTNVRGFTCWGAHVGIKSMRRDLAIIYSEVPAAAAATFTRNEVIAEPVKVSKRNIADGRAQVIICNAGNANACTGSQGREGAEAMVTAAAETLNIDPSLVLVASTGIIGEPFPTEEVVGGIRANMEKLSNESKAGSFAANAILTTDTFAKEGFVEYEIDGVSINLAGIAKGSGMIHPNMGTMLAFIVTDIAIEPPVLDTAVRNCVEDTFNMITVDGDTSTNDMVAVLANGMAGNDPITSIDDPRYPAFYENLKELMAHLAKLIVSDGEGCSKYIEYSVHGARDKDAARRLVRAISSSILVKTAMTGRDPNWGRIIAAAGNAGVPFDHSKVDLALGSEEIQVSVLENGRPVEFDRNNVKRLLRESHITVQMDLHDGDAKAVGWGTDLTTDYIIFNSVYTS
ncbi:MAG: bifunctional glutamate N-acetyltransferase/amino-acid acetyltransferase ArgJ [Bacteroidetes bacterium]|nr:bifunctional glutamate N-acetyltransferase/amino-acid acetyltransferase ArgJ [Bacteroidota bacterium]